jgi:VCBS repeat-containing protein
MGPQPANGTVVMQSHGAFSYTPNSNFTGTDTFTYKVSDGTSESPSTTVTITVTATNRPPVAANDAYSTDRNTALTVPAPGILSNDSDPDQGNTITASLVSTTPASAGTLVLNPNGSFTFTPVNDFTGQATFRYRVRDNHNAESNEAIVTITVNASNRPPVAVNDSYTTNRNEPLTVDAPGILGNDSDPDEGNTITAVLVNGPPASAGTLTLNANGSFTFTPANNYAGTTTFTYRARDNNDASSTNTATVSIEVKDVATSGQVCYDGGASRTQYRATLDWSRLENGDISVRATVSRNYADNTYGVNKIGWGNRNRDFKSVRNSDFGQLAFYDANGARRLEFKIDYLAPKSGTPSGYGSMGVSNGQQADGGMVFGSAANIVALGTSMDVNFNGFGYVTTSSNHPLKSYSPPTNSSYATTATYPLWIWDMWYEATVRASTFGSAGFGYPRLTGLHASPSKADVNSWRMITCQ